MSRRGLDGQEKRQGGPVRVRAQVTILCRPRRRVVLPVPDSEAARIMASVAPASLKNRLFDLHWPGLQGE
jgi:hypothetical protein